eukprot:724113-Amphidinium_carterae.1
MQGIPGQLGYHRAKTVVAPAPPSTSATSAGQPAGSVVDNNLAGYDAPCSVGLQANPVAEKPSDSNGNYVYLPWPEKRQVGRPPSRVLPTYGGFGYTEGRAGCEGRGYYHNVECRRKPQRSTETLGAVQGKNNRRHPVVQHCNNSSILFGSKADHPLAVGDDILMRGLTCRLLVTLNLVMEAHFYI